MHWIQNKSLDNYPTSMLRQLNYPPGSSILILHLNLLSESDRFANLVQWFSMAASLAGISLIAKELGANRFVQIMAMVLASTLPTGILEASSVQNDYVVTLWLVCYIVFGLRFIRTLQPLDAMAASTALALAANIKGTGYLVALPFLIFFLFRSFKRSPSKSMLMLTGSLAVLLLINCLYFARNLSLTGTIIPPSETSKMIVKHVTPRSTVNNIIRNAASNLTSTSHDWNTLVYRAVSNLTRQASAGQGQEAEPFQLTGHPFHEDNSGNALHLLMIIFLLIFLAVARIRKRTPAILSYVAALGAGFILYTAVVSWTPFNVRYQLPFFVLCAPACALVFSAISRRLCSTVAIICLAASTPWISANASRPLLGASSILFQERPAQYFMNNPGYIYSYLAAIKTMDAIGCKDVGLYFGDDAWEYPLWALAKEQELVGIRFEHVLTRNASGGKPYPSGPFDPCAVLSETPTAKDILEVSGRTFSKTRVMPFLTVFLPQTGRAASRMSSALRHAITPLNVPSDLHSLEDTTRAVFMEIVRKTEQNADIDPVLLKRHSPDLFQRWETVYSRGLFLMKDGFINKDGNSIRRGQTLLMEWYNWVNTHRQDVEKALRLP
jgi:hypothetical protein